MQEIQFWRSFLQEYRKTKDIKQTRALLFSFTLAEAKKKTIELICKKKLSNQYRNFAFCDLK